MKARHEALQVLDEIIALKFSKEGKVKRANRITDCLKAPDAESAEGWNVCVPKCFNDALDIKTTVLGGEPTWTQGGAFSFKKGDVLCRRRHDPGGPNPGGPNPGDLKSGHLKSGHLADAGVFGDLEFYLQITAASSAVPASAEKARFSGSVVFSVYQPNEAKSGIEYVSSREMTQDDFIRYLIAGDASPRISQPALFS